VKDQPEVLEDHILIFHFLNIHMLVAMNSKCVNFPQIVCCC